MNSICVTIRNIPNKSKHIAVDTGCLTNLVANSMSTTTITYRDLVDKSIRPLLDANDKLREVLDGEEIRLPTIAVIGGQSAGKSSILERISNVDLPRGGGMVTRCGKNHFVIVILNRSCSNLILHFPFSMSYPCSTRDAAQVSS